MISRISSVVQRMGETELFEKLQTRPEAFPKQRRSSLTATILASTGLRKNRVVGVERQPVVDTIARKLAKDVGRLRLAEDHREHVHDDNEEEGRDGVSLVEAATVPEAMASVAINEHLRAGGREEQGQ